MQKNRTLSLLLLLIAHLAAGQFGNEWIEENKTYYKFKIGKDEFYRITRDELQGIGFPVATVPPNRIQLFREGREVAINVATTGNQLDYLEFFGQAKDGTSDSPLYENGAQPHTYYSLFTDSASYFITYHLGNEDGLRMGSSLDINTSGLTPESYHLEDSIQLFNTSYASGLKFGQGSNFSLSKYDIGEGWTGNAQSKNAFKDFDFLLEDRTSDVDIAIESVLVGGNSLAHNAAVSVGPNNSSLTTIQNVQFSGWGFTQFSNQFEDSNVGPGGELTIRVLAEGFPNASERFSVAYMRMVYPQETVMSSNENKIFTLDDVRDRRAWVRIQTDNTTDVRVFEVADPYAATFMTAPKSSTEIDIVVPDVSAGNKIMVVNSPKSVGAIEQVTFPNYDLSDKNYLIITHEDLRESGDPVAAYEAYRESVAGGSHDVQVAEIDELYELFSYGDPTPLAIRNFLQYAVTQGAIDNVFIIGKGFTPNFNYYRGDQTAVNVPTYGLPGTDLMYTLGIGANAEVPGIPIGRLNATEPAQVVAYLDKITEMESLPFDDLFRKDFLQLSGGINEGEINQFIQIVEGFTTTLEKDFIGGRAFNTGKETSESVEFIDVSGTVNEGVGYITFFGHSSGTVTDIEIGRVSDPEFGFANKGKYPIFLVNGCQAGEIFGNNFTFGEDWILEPELGAVGFIAHTATALASTLRNWSNLFYNLGFGDDEFIGKTIGEVMIEVSKRYFDQNGSNGINLTQMQQMQLQGDPAYRVFGADNPDYEINSNSVTASALDAEEILATQDSFKIEMIVRNFGRTAQDSLLVRVDRTYADGSANIYLQEYLRPLRQDTLEFFIPMEPTRNNEGVNSLTVRLDPENSTQELNETNNTVSLEVPIFRGNTLHLFPINNGTQADNMVEFIWQASNPLESERSYELEINTQPDFAEANPNRRTFTVSGEVILRQSFDFSTLSLPDSSTVYWRTRFSDPQPDESNVWTTGSFTLIENIADGWGQYEEGQVQEAFLSGIEFDEVMNQWRFIQSETPIDIFTFGIDNTDFTTEDMQAIIGGIDFFVTSNTIDPTCENNTFNAIAFDKESGDPYRPIQTTAIDVFNREVCGRLPQRIYQFREDDMIGPTRRFAFMVDNMRDGDMIVMFNMGNVNYSSWDAEIISTLNELGVSSGTISALTDGQPVIFFGRKGDAPGSATLVLNNGTSTPITEQSINLQDDVNGSFTSGQIKTRRIGPAKDWQSFSYNLTEEMNDSFTLDLFGITPDGESNSLVSRGRAETVDVSTIDPVLYPELELVFGFNDETDQTPPQLDFWEVNYDYPPEGVLLTSIGALETVQEGQEISRELRFVNISNENFTDSLTVMARLINQTNGTILESSFKIGPPSAGDTTVFSANFPSFDLDGLNTLILDIAANENEAYTTNNRLTLTNLIEVIADETNPIIDVTFDGFHILDGDVVSPNPMISVKMRDDNEFAVKTDTAGFHISLRQPGEENQFQRINFSDPRLNYRPATELQDFEIDFQPGPLADGVYAIRVRAEDVSGNEAGTEPYEINFEVINESTVTHFYPYPNPFSTSCRFVFTLTGSEIPDQIKIQIMTVSGRVVREITQDEIGPIRIGPNITSYAWDGRDQYGDQLANGVYFYKVFINSNGNEMTRRATSADRAFKNGFGKLYILR